MELDYVIVTTDPRGVTFDGERFWAGDDCRDRAMRYVGAMRALHPSYVFEVWSETHAPAGQNRERSKIC